MEVISLQFDRAAIENALQGVAGHSWLFEWGMYLLLLAALGIALWVFFDSNSSGKGDAALQPRIISMVGVFLILPAFIFRFTGTADGITRVVRLEAEAGQPLYESAINFNVNWLVSGYGSIISIVALAGMLVSIFAAIQYSTQKSKGNVSRTVFERLLSKQTATHVPASPAVGGVTLPSGPPPTSTGTSTVISKPGVQSDAVKTVFSRPAVRLTAESGPSNGKTWDLSANDAIIGRDSNSAVTVQIGDPEVSGQHAKLKHQNGTWSILDLGSTNRTFVNGSEIAGQTELESGALIRVGDTTLTFEKI